MRKELALSAAAIGLVSILEGVKPTEALWYSVHNQYPICGSEIGFPQNHTAWIVDVTENEKRKMVSYDLGLLPGQCGNPDGNNDIEVSVTLNASHRDSGDFYSPNNISLPCFIGAHGFAIRIKDGFRGYGFNAISGGLDPKQPTFLNRLRINQDHPNGEYTGTDIFSCQTAYGTEVPVRKIHRTIQLTR